ncbi:hypothetical protein OG21DRAFT_1103277 [Imleria badia]|nr:hypothetical protein OG21DRAFT_1103277 [Imleria badia]
MYGITISPVLETCRRSWDTCFAALILGAFSVMMLHCQGMTECKISIPRSPHLDRKVGLCLKVEDDGKPPESKYRDTAMISRCFRIAPRL